MLRNLESTANTYEAATEVDVINILKDNSYPFKDVH